MSTKIDSIGVPDVRIPRGNYDGYSPSATVTYLDYSVEQNEGTAFRTLVLVRAGEAGRAAFVFAPTTPRYPRLGQDHV